MSFTHLHVHSEYSLLSGMCRIDKMIQKAKDLGMTSLAITDYGALYGAFKFFIHAKDAGLKPIIGVELYKAKHSRFDKQGSEGKDQDHLILLAKDLVGYKNLLKIVTAGQLEGMDIKPRVDFEVLEKYKEGLIAISSAMDGEISDEILHNKQKEAEVALKRYEQIYGHDFYLEIQRHPGAEAYEQLNRDLIALSRSHGIPLVATNGVHYLEKEDAYAQEVLLCIQSGRAIFEKERKSTKIDIPDFYMKSPEEMAELFADLPEAIENTEKIASQCNVEIPYGKWELPRFDTPNNIPPEQYLRELVENNKGRVSQYPQDVVNTRLEYELGIIISKGYATYFLIVQDFVNWSKNNGVAVGPGRGSVAGSLVAYVLRISDINPLEYNLPFERFLNPERPTPPDIDIDFADTRRDQVLGYVTRKYGADRVAQIITFGTMEARLVVRDVTRAFGLSYSQGDRLAKMIPQGKQGFSMSIAQALIESPALKFAYQTEPDVKKVLDTAQKLEGLPRHSSVHAAGVVISAEPLTNYVPLQREQKEGRIITQYDMYCIDLNAVSNNKAVGLLKIDFLGLRNLTILEEAIKYVKQTKGLLVDLHDIAMDDKKAYDLISRGQTIGVFQLESAGMRRLAKDFQPTKLTDITAMVALYRPGPMGLIPDFVEGKKNPKSVRYLTPGLKPILSETYGVLVYQEQVMEIAHKLAGFTMSEADLLRMAMGKKKKSLMEKGKKQFIEGCVKNKLTASLAENIYGFIEKFAAYGFNKPHAASYALIAYWTAYMKANYPVEFMCALLTAELKGVAGSLREIKMAQALEECRSMDIEILIPDINHSYLEFSIEGAAIRFGMSAIKNVGAAAIESIVSSRKEKQFESFTDFLFRVDLRKVNKRTVESLVKAGAFTQFGNRATLLSAYPIVVKEAADRKNEQDGGQTTLFSNDQKSIHTDTFPKLIELSDIEVAMMEKEVVGFLISKNPLEQFAEILKKKVTKKMGEVLPEDTGKVFVFGGIISGKKMVKTKKTNAEMLFLTVADDTGSAEVVVFPKTYQSLKDICQIQKVILFKGKVDFREDRQSILMENAVDLERIQTKSS